MKTKSEQFPDTARLRKRIQKLRAKKMKWSQICSELAILDEHGKPDTGTAFHIADGLELGMNVRKRLGLKPYCTTCRRVVREKKEHDIYLHQPLPEHVRWFRKLPKQLRDEMILDLWLEEHR